MPTIRAFYPVRAFPDMPDADVGDAYAALRRFHALADDPRFELTFRLGPGDIMCFDNRRVIAWAQGVFRFGAAPPAGGVY